MSFSRLARAAVFSSLALALLCSSSPVIVSGGYAIAKGGKSRQSVTHERKGGRTRTVTRTVTQQDGIVIPEEDDGVAGNPYPSTLEVRGLKKGRIVDLDLTLHGFAHEIPLDVDILLVKEGKNPTAVQVIGDVGDVSFDDVEFITLDDEATESLPYFDALTSGRFKPTDHDDPGSTADTFPPPAPAVEFGNELTAFDGLNPNGTWQLFVYDAQNEAGGSIDGWELTMEVKVKSKKKR